MTNGASYTEAENTAILAAANWEEYAETARANGWPHRRSGSFAQRRSVLRREDSVVSRCLRIDLPYTSIADLDPDPVEPPRLKGKPQNDDDYEELFAHLEAVAERRGELHESVKRVDWHAPVDGPVGVAFFSDIHAGAGGVDYKRFRADVERLRDTEGLYGVVNGDLMENSKPQSKSGTALYSSVFANPKEQLEYVKRRLAIAQGKWLVVTQGNHDAFDYRQAGIDRLPSLVQELGSTYANESGVDLRVTSGVQRYSLIVKHDYAGKSRINKSNSQRRAYEEWPFVLDQVTADVVALAHLHEPDLHLTMKRGHPVVLLRSGTYKTQDSWAESAGYKPAYGVPVVVLDPSEKRVTPFADYEAGIRFLEGERRRWRNR